MVKTRDIFAKFTPSEVAHITGISTALQRDWRRRGLLEKKNEGWSQFDLDDVVRLSVAGLLIEHGIAARFALDAAVAPHIQFLTMIGERSTEFDPELPESLKTTWARKIPQRVKKRFRRFYIYARNFHEFPRNVTITDNLNKIFDGWREEGIDAGAAIVIDLESLADRIVDRAGRPLMRVELVDDD